MGNRVVNVSPSANSNKEFKPIPNGTRVLASVYAIEEVAVKSGDNAGQPQLDITFKVQGGEYNGREIRYQKIPLYDGPGAWKLTTFAEALGWPHENGSVSLPDDWNTVLGQTLTIKVNEKAPDAQKRVFNEVGGYAPASAAPAEATGGSVGGTAPAWGNLGR